MPVVERRSAVREKGYCYQCLYASHTREWCRSRATCKVCNANHHTMLHVDSSKHTQQRINNKQPNSDTRRRERRRPSHQRTYICKTPKKDTTKQQVVKEKLGERFKAHIFLPTALARVLTKDDSPNKARLLLNSGVADTIVLDSLVRRLKLRITRRDNKDYCTLNLQSFYDTSAKIQIRGIVREQLNTPLPESTNEKGLQRIYNHFTNLADPHFYKPVDIEIMIGNDEITKIYKAGLVQTSSNMPIAFSTVFGWVISGACHY